MGLILNVDNLSMESHLCGCKLLFVICLYQESGHSVPWSPWPTLKKRIWPRRATTINCMGQKAHFHTHCGFLEARWSIWFEPKKKYPPRIFSYICVDAVLQCCEDNAPPAEHPTVRCCMFTKQLLTQQWAVTHRGISFQSLWRIFCNIL